MLFKISKEPVRLDLRCLKNWIQDQDSLGAMEQFAATHQAKGARKVKKSFFFLKATFFNDVSDPELGTWGIFGIF